MLSLWTKALEADEARHFLDTAFAQHGLNPNNKS